MMDVMDMVSNDERSNVTPPPRRKIHFDGFCVPPSSSIDFFRDLLTLLVHHTTRTIVIRRQRKALFAPG
jgi:hypothetical protein